MKNDDILEKINSLDPKLHKSLRKALLKQISQTDGHIVIGEKDTTDLSQNPELNRLYIDETGTLVLPSSSNPNYHGLSCGQNILDILRDLGANIKVVDSWLN